MGAALSDEQKIAVGREMAEAWRALDWRKGADMLRAGQMVDQLAALRATHAGDQLDKLALAVAVDAAERSNFPGPQFERRPGDGGQTRRVMPSLRSAGW